ncbi:MAG: Lrp/AsnC family transcriptional regulator [Caldimicrobium thiodismutans]
MKEAYKKLLNLIQKEFPLEERPFQVLGEKAGLSEEEVISFLKDLKEKGILRHLGASPDSIKLGHFTCLCATSLPEEKLSLAEKISNLPEVTHAYLRDHKYNFWFTLVLPKKEDLEPYLKRLEEEFQIKIKAFPAEKKFKVKAVFEL